MRLSAAAGIPARHRSGDDEPVVGGEERLLPADGDHVTVGVRSRQANGGRSGVGAVEAELDHFCARNQVDEALCGFALDPVRADKIQAVGQPAARGVHHWLESMAECGRAQAVAELDVLVAVQVPHAASSSALNHWCHASGVLVVPLRVGVRSAGN